MSSPTACAVNQLMSLFVRYPALVFNYLKNLRSARLY
jgi:hypothetical protein